MSIYLNQRTDKRNRYIFPFLYSRDKSNECYSAEMWDCSKSGMSFLSDFPYLPNTVINVKTSEEHDAYPIRVRWCQRVLDDQEIYQHAQEYPCSGTGSVKQCGDITVTKEGSDVYPFVDRDFLAEGNTLIIKYACSGETCKYRVSTTTMSIPVTLRC